MATPPREGGRRQNVVQERTHGSFLPAQDRSASPQCNPAQPAMLGRPPGCCHLFFDRLGANLRMRPDPNAHGQSGLAEFEPKGAGGGFRVSGSEFRVPSSEFRVSGFGVVGLWASLSENWESHLVRQRGGW